MIENKENEVTLIYHSDKHDDKKARGYVETLRGKAIKTIDLAKESLTETQLAEIALKMNVEIEDLIDSTYDDHISVHKGGLKLIDRQGMLTLLVQDSKLLKTPIVIKGSSASFVGSGYEFVKEDFAEGQGIKHANAGEG